MGSGKGQAKRVNTAIENALSSDSKHNRMHNYFNSTPVTLDDGKWNQWVEEEDIQERKFVNYYLGKSDNDEIIINNEIAGFVLTEAIRDVIEGKFWRGGHVLNNKGNYVPWREDPNKKLWYSSYRVEVNDNAMLLFEKDTDKPIAIQTLYHPVQFENKSKMIVDDWSSHPLNYLQSLLWKASEGQVGI